MSDPGGPSSDRPAAAVPQAAAEPLRVLICDDNPETADMLAAVMELAGCNTQAVNDAAHAIDAVLAFKPHVAILDLQLHGPVTGFDLARRLRADRSQEDLVLVAFSGHVSQADRFAAFAAGFDRFIAKPAQPAELLATLPYVQAPLQPGVPPAVQ